VELACLVVLARRSLAAIAAGSEYILSFFRPWLLRLLARGLCCDFQQTRGLQIQPDELFSASTLYKTTLLAFKACWCCQRVSQGIEHLIDATAGIKSSSLYRIARFASNRDI
jgi:hypothetical protein